MLFYVFNLTKMPLFISLSSVFLKT